MSKLYSWVDNSTSGRLVSFILRDVRPWGEEVQKSYLENGENKDTKKSIIV